MVTFINAGRMGNWLFEAATAIAYAFRHGLDFTVPDRTNNQYHNPIYCTHLVNPKYNPTLPEIRLWESKHEYEELPFQEVWRNCNVIIEGYRQSESYFKDYHNEIVALFNFRWAKKSGVVGVHVRRGDYVYLVQKHPQVTKEWYESAMALFPDKTFKFFSDDIQWCKDNFGDREDCEFSTNTSEVADMEDLSSCEHQIMSASTFGLWGYFLNRNEDKIGVIPKLWFVEGYNLNTFDIVPERIIKL